MDNLINVTSAVQLHKMIDEKRDKLLVLMLFTKNNPECRKAKVSLDKIVGNHSLARFCIVDMDRFDGESPHVTTITHFPKFNVFYQGVSIGTFSSSNERDIEGAVSSSERYIITQNNARNNSMNQPWPQNNQPPPQNYTNNPSIPPLFNQYPNAQHYGYNTNQPIYPNMTGQQPLNTHQHIPINVQHIQNSGQKMHSESTDSKVIPNEQIIPTFQQMQYMFQIFQMMQKMGIIPIPAVLPDNEKESMIELPNGDKLIQLTDGKYGLIRNKTSNLSMNE